jgi:hypothetical protein
MRPVGQMGQNDTGGVTMMEECFYCGGQARQADIDRLGKCPSCMEQMTRAAETAARESMAACYTVGPNPWKMY